MKEIGTHLKRDKMHVAYRINKWLVVLTYKELIGINTVEPPREKLANAFIDSFVQWEFIVRLVCVNYCAGG